jgi:hypothetical protein
MTTADITSIPPDILADNEAVLAHITAGVPLDPQTARRVRERAERITAEIRRRHGVLDLGVPAIRELRDGE